MAEWDAWSIGLQLFVFVAITVALMVQATTKRRAPRLKNSKQVEATLFLDNTSILPVKLFLPSRQFISNLMASLDRHTQEARIFWEHEKLEFIETFNRLTDELKVHLMDTLSTELSDSLQCYNPMGDFAAILCPTLKHSKKLLEYTTYPPSSSSASVDKEGKTNGNSEQNEEEKEGVKVLNIIALFDFLMEKDMRNALESRPAISVARIKVIDLGEGPDGNMIKPPPPSIDTNLKDEDKNGKTKNESSSKYIHDRDNLDDDESSDNKGEGKDTEDIEIESMSPDELDLREDTENLLKGLKILCYLLFMKQFLSRYHSHQKPPSKLWKVAKAVGKSGLFAISTGVVMYIVVEYNLIGYIWPEFDSSHGSWRPTTNTGDEF